MVGIVLDILAAVKAVEAQRIAEAQRILANGMALHQFVDHFGVALNNPLHQSVAFLLGGLGIFVRIVSEKSITFVTNC